MDGMLSQDEINALLNGDGDSGDSESTSHFDGPDADDTLPVS